MSTVTIAHVIRIAHELYAIEVAEHQVAIAGVTSPNAKTLAEKTHLNLHEGKNLATIVNLTVKAAGFKGAVKPQSDPVWATLLADCETRNRSEGAKKAQPVKSKPAGKGKATPKDKPVSESVKVNRAIAEAASGLPPMVEGIKVALLEERVGRMEQGMQDILALLTKLVK